MWVFVLTLLIISFLLFALFPTGSSEINFNNKNVCSERNKIRNNVHYGAEYNLGDFYFLFDAENEIVFLFSYLVKNKKYEMPYNSLYQVNLYENNVCVKRVRGADRVYFVDSIREMENGIVIIGPSMELNGIRCWCNDSFNNVALDVYNAFEFIMKNKGECPFYNL